MVRESASASAVTAGGVVQNVKNAPFLKDIEVLVCPEKRVLALRKGSANSGIPDYVIPLVALGVKHGGESDA